MTLPIRTDGTIDWHEWHKGAERDAFYQARAFLTNAKLIKRTKPSLPGDPYWINEFVKDARRYNQCGVYHRRKAKELANV